MKISRLTLPILTLNFLIDKGEKYSVDDVFKYVEDGTIFDKLRSRYNKLYTDIRMDGFNLTAHSFKEDEKELIEALQRLANAVLPEEFGVDNRDNGLIFLIGMLNELIQANVEDIHLR